MTLLIRTLTNEPELIAVHGLASEEKGSAGEGTLAGGGEGECAGRVSPVGSSAVQCSAVQFIAMEYNAVRCIAMHCSTVQCSTVHCTAVCTAHCTLHTLQAMVTTRGGPGAPAPLHPD
jgi:hypothetical protein